MVTLVNGNKSEVLGKEMNVSVSFEQWEAEIDFFLLLYVSLIFLSGVSINK